MLKPARRRRRPQAVKPNVIDRAVAFIDPVRGARRLKARVFMALTGGYVGASKSRRALKQWSPYGHDADADVLPDLPTLRERSRDMVRNIPLAAGIIKTKVTSVVGSGLNLKAQIDAEALGLDDDAADRLERQIEREWRLFFFSKECDAARTLTGNANARLSYRQAKENGDVFINLPRIPRAGIPYDLRLQVIEADRVCNKDNAADSETLAGGVKRDGAGAPIEFHVLKHHPGNLRTVRNAQWQIVKAYGAKTGLRNIIHLYAPDRPNQSRGVPDLAPVIEPLKQLGRYTDYELMAAAVSGMFTVFIETQTGEANLDLTGMSDETGAEASDTDYKLASGAIIGLAPGEKIHDSNPGRPNAAFDPFVLAILRQIGVALELPFELLIKHFTASYSAARSALLEAWKYFVTERNWLAENFYQPIYEIWMHEAVAKGRLPMPGFFADPAIRQAYLGAKWIGPARGDIDEVKAVKAAQARVDGGFATLDEETGQMTGGSWERNHRQRVKENNARKADGLVEPANNEDPPNDKDNEP
jgi:lambda family phage portal protein